MAGEDLNRKKVKSKNRKKRKKTLKYLKVKMHLSAIAMQSPLKGFQNIISFIFTTLFHPK